MFVWLVNTLLSSCLIRPSSYCLIHFYKRFKVGFYSTTPISQVVNFRLCCGSGRSLGFSGNYFVLTQLQLLRLWLFIGMSNKFGYPQFEVIFHQKLCCGCHCSKIVVTVVFVVKKWKNRKIVSMLWWLLYTTIANDNICIVTAQQQQQPQQQNNNNCSRVETK